MANHAINERHALTATLRDVGPTAPTLCEGWQSTELLEHLFCREHSLTELLGHAPVPALRDRAATARTKLLAPYSYESLLTKFNAGPPNWSPWACPPLRERVNLIEYAVHHEDVLRAQPDWQPRQIPLARAHAIYTNLRSAVLLTMARVPVGVSLLWPGHEPITTRKARRDIADAVTVVGPPMELTLVAFGRGAAAEVTYEGPRSAIAAFHATTIKC